MPGETQTSAFFRTWGNPLFSMRSGTICSVETPTRAGDSVWEQLPLGKTQTECVVCKVGTSDSRIRCLFVTLRISDKTAGSILRDSLYQGIFAYSVRVDVILFTHIKECGLLSRFCGTNNYFQKLIILVQARECLYNLQHVDYDNSLVKGNWWKEVAG